MAERSNQVAILGAGIAGLVASLRLIRAGQSVTIFEARSRTGGRIQSMMLAGMLLECGPEFIHGRLKETLNLLDKYHIPYEAIDGKMYSGRSGVLRETYDMAEGWEELLTTMKSLKTDLPFNKFLGNYFPGNAFTDLRNAAVGYAEGFDLADTETASTLALLREWEQEESEQYRIPSGYGELIHALENEFINTGGKIKLNHPVARVDWNTDGVRLTVTGQPVHSADRLLVTLPLSLLNQSAPVSERIQFFPSLDDKMQAFREIGFGTVVKIVLIWQSAFWDKLIPDAQFIFSDQFIPTWWTQFPQRLPMLTGWLGGPKAASLSNEPDSFFLDKAMESLASIFSLSAGGIKKGLLAYRVFNWRKEFWSRGAYSFPLPESEKAKAIIREPVMDQIYFAGEAYYEGPYPGTVEAAVISALETAERML